MKAKDNLDKIQNDFLLYTTENAKIKVDVLLQNETVWLAQKARGHLLGVESHAITYHIKGIYKSGELE